MELSQLAQKSEHRPTEKHEQRHAEKGLVSLVWLSCIALALTGTALVGMARAMETVGDCTNLSSITPGQQCSVAWQDLKPQVRPTQAVLGYAWVQRKVNNNFQSSKDAQKELDGEVEPLVRGPGQVLYLIDGHHTLGALDLSGFLATKVTVELVCDWSELSESAFWDKMEKNGFVYLYVAPLPNSSPVRIQPSELPDALDMQRSPPTLQDDPWRSWAAYVRKVQDMPGFPCPSGYNKYCMRGYDRVCNSQGGGIPFFEFRWAYFMAQSYNQSALWDAYQDEYHTFLQNYQALPFPTPLSSSPNPLVDEWTAAAYALVYLCRDQSAGAFVIPDSYGSLAGPLPGYVKGMVPLEDGDPTCATPTCPPNQPSLEQFSSSHPLPVAASSSSSSAEADPLPVAASSSSFSSSSAEAVTTLQVTSTTVASKLFPSYRLLSRHFPSP